MGEVTKKYRPSNGTEGFAFMDRWCANCTKEDAEKEQYCLIATKSMGYELHEPEYPAEWTYDDKGKPICTAYESRLAEPKTARQLDTVTIDMFVNGEQVVKLVSK